MQALRARQALAITALAVLLVGGFGFSLIRSQRQAEAELIERFEERAVLGAKFTDSVLRTSTGQNVRAANDLLAKSRVGLSRALRAYLEGEPTPRIEVLDARRRVLAAVPAGRHRRSNVERRAEQRAVAGLLTISDVFHVRGVPVVDFDIPFRSGGHLRVLSDSIPIDVITQFVGGYLTTAPAVRGARAYLTDGRRRVIAATSKDKPGGPLTDVNLRKALKAASSGSFDGRHYVAKPIAFGNWHIVFTAPERELLAPVRGEDRRTGWMLFAALVLALAGLVAMGGKTLRRSEQLSQAREREASALERERNASALAHERLHDALTGLPNRALFLDRVEHALAGLVRRERPLLVMFVDVDRFKRVNDSLGHGSGDHVLREIARRLRATVRPTDTVSRFGGDEFLILCEAIADEREAMRIASRVEEALESAVVVGNRELHVTACIGIALQRPADQPTDPATLIRDADAAMYRAKEAGPGSIAVFDPELHEAALARLELEMGLRHAIDRNELRVHYQPIVSLHDDSLRGVEALVRWERPDGTLVPPLDFIPLAEDTGMIVPLGAWVLEHAMREVVRWQAAGWVAEDFSLTVNLSPRQLNDPGLPALVEDLTRRTGLRAHNLCLEITESVVMDDLDAAVEALHAIKALGVKLALDDFGVGHSSLGQVARLLPIDILKVDRSFVQGIAHPRERAVLETISSLAAALELTAVAEGIETREQAVALAEMGYPLAQGFLFGRPGPREEIKQLKRGVHQPV